MRISCIDEDDDDNDDDDDCAASSRTKRLTLYRARQTSTPRPLALYCRSTPASVLRWAKVVIWTRRNDAVCAVRTKVSDGCVL